MAPIDRTVLDSPIASLSIFVGVSFAITIVSIGVFLCACCGENSKQDKPPESGSGTAIEKVEKVDAVAMVPAMAPASAPAPAQTSIRESSTIGKVKPPTTPSPAQPSDRHLKSGLSPPPQIFNRDEDFQRDSNSDDDKDLIKKMPNFLLTSPKCGDFNNAEYNVTKTTTPCPTTDPPSLVLMSTKMAPDIAFTSWKKKKHKYRHPPKLPSLKEINSKEKESSITVRMH